MSYRLRSELFYCISSGRVIFLDVLADRYFCLPRRSDAAFQALSRGSALTGSDRDALRPLIENGLIRGSLEVDQPLPVTSIPRPDVALNSIGDGRPTKSMIAQAIYAQAMSTVSLRVRSFSQIVESLRTRKKNGQALKRERRAAYIDIKSTFTRTTLLFPPADRCLARSLAFLSVCHAYRLYPTIVFGVRTNPFAAHCWVQSEDHILQDDAAEAPLFTPIMAI
ncbi:lasso peptide biosynthesis B2 protein [Sphingomonas histidinilytica]|uniref:lasso peptide biosynthesis B2 protein n=1 Tax=Rhizorhabdus histidinilytica TaxID=439228 RepID=UPI001ADB799B|nr:lasso peptide biosynthesis B2 protein [Rhizorhabdus histidinilytica]